MDRIASFFDDCCVFEPQVVMARDALRLAYEDWCKEQGLRFPLPAKEVADR